MDIERIENPRDIAQLEAQIQVAAEAAAAIEAAVAAQAADLENDSDDVDMLDDDHVDDEVLYEGQGIEVEGSREVNNDDLATEAEVSGVGLILTGEQENFGQSQGGSSVIKGIDGSSTSLKVKTSQDFNRAVRPVKGRMVGTEIGISNYSTLKSPDGTPTLHI